MTRNDEFWNYTDKPREEWDYGIWVRYFLEHGATIELAQAMAKNKGDKEV